MTSEEFILDVKTKYGTQRTRDGRLISDLDDKELLTKMLERYPGERENIEDVDMYLGEEVDKIPEVTKTEVQSQLDTAKRSLFSRIGDQFRQASERSESIDESEDSFVGKLIQKAGTGASLVTGVVGEGIKSLPVVGQAAEFVEEKVGQGFEAVTNKIADTEFMQDAGRGYAAVDSGEQESGFEQAAPELLRDAAAAGEVAGLALGAKSVKPTLTATKDVAKAGAAKVADIAESRRVAQAAKVRADVDTAVKNIVQPTGKTLAERTKQVESAKRTLLEVKIEDAKDYASLKGTLDDKVKAIVANQDAHLANFPEKFKPDQLGTYTKVGDETVVTTPVQDALDGLENAYRLSGDAVAATKIRQLKTQMETEGLDVAQINKIARDYNVEFKDKAFDTLGNPKAGFNAENYEAVRKGVKEVARDRMPDGLSKELDAKLADIYETKAMIDKLAVAVDKKIAKLPKNSPFRKAVSGAVSVADTLTGSIVSNILRGIAAKAGVLQKEGLSVLELQDALQKNLKKLQQLDSIEDPQQFQKALEELN
jgi:hypothetical protein